MKNAGYTVAELDYENRTDLEITAGTADTTYKLIPATQDYDLYAWVEQLDPTMVVYTKEKNPLANDPIYDQDGTQIATATNSPGGPNIVIDGVGYYAWEFGNVTFYTKSATPQATGPVSDPSRYIYDSNGDVRNDYYLVGYNSQWDFINVSPIAISPILPVWSCPRIPSASELHFTIYGTPHAADYDSSKNIYSVYATLPRATVSVFDGDEYKWDDTLDDAGNYTKSLADLTNPRVGFMINATLESHPIDVGGRTYTYHKRIGKAVAVIRNTEPNAFTVCDKTGYTSVDKKKVNFYGCTGMKDQIRYTIKNIQGAKFTIESLTMIIEYATLDS